MPGTRRQRHNLGTGARGQWPVAGLIAATLYVILGLADMSLSSVALLVGVPEANPVLAWAAARGLFVPTKLLLTLAVGAGLARLWGLVPGRVAAWAALLAMAAVDGYHLWGLAWLVRS